MIIIIDFDGTCVTHEFPGIGEDIGAEEVLKDLLEEGHKLILFTMRSDRPGARYLSEAIEWFEDRNIPLFGIQTNPEQKEWTDSPKAYGELIIDDASLGCPLLIDEELSDRPFVDWEEVRNMLVEIGVLSG